MSGRPCKGRQCEEEGEEWKLRFSWSSYFCAVKEVLLGYEVRRNKVDYDARGKVLK